MKPMGNEEELHCVDGVQTNWKGGATTANGRAGYGKIPNVGGDVLGEFIYQKFAQLE